MSYLEKSKRQAKRLLQLSKNTPDLAVPVKNLSEAQNVIAVIDGYNNWHNYSENLKNKDLQNTPAVPITHLDVSMRYLPQTHIETFEKYYLNSPSGKVNVFTTPKPSLSFNIRNTGMYVPIGKHKEKKGWTEKEQIITLRSQHGTIWSEPGAAIHLHKDILEKIIKKDTGAIFVDTNENNTIYSDIYQICKKYNYADNFYCINFMAKNKEKSTHSFDPINPLIPFKDQFFNIFNIKNNLFSELFYKLCKDCYDRNIAVDSTVILHFLSLKSLIENKNENLQVIFNNCNNEITTYLNSIGIAKELNKDWLTNSKEAIQNHHLQVQNILFIAGIVKDYEDKGVFSVFPHIDLENIVAHNKILTVLFPKLTKDNPYVKELENIFMTQLLTTEIGIIESLKGSIVPVTNELVGFLSIQIFDSIQSLLNPYTLQLFDKLLSDTYHSRKILTFICATSYKSLENNFTLPSDKHLLSIFMSRFLQHMVMRQSTPVTDFCYEIKNQILTNCKNIENIFHKDSRHLYDLEINQMYFYKVDNATLSDYRQTGLMYKLNYYSPISAAIRDIEVLWVEHEPVRK